jgi:hypothetical protein
VFQEESRYSTVGEAEITDQDGQTVRYKRIRFIPPTNARFHHVINEGERLDHLAYRYYRDPERFWRICDANEAMWPPDLTDEAGRRIAIPPASGE